MIESRIKNSIRNSLWGTILRIVTIIVPFIFRTIIIHEIGAAYIGINGLFKSILQVLNMSELGFGSSVVFMMYKPIAENNKVELCRLLNLMKSIYRIVGLVVLVGGLCAFPLMNVLVKNDTGVDVNVYLLYSMYLFQTVTSYWMFSYRSTLFTAYQRSDILSKVALCINVVMYVLQAIMLYFTKNYYFYLMVYSLMGIPQNLAYYFLSRKYFPDIHCEGKPTKDQINELKSKVIPLMGHRIGGTVIVSIDGIIISAFLGVTLLTKYDNYYYIISAIIGFLTVFRQGITASLGNKLYTDSKEKTYHVYKRVAFVWIMLVGWCSACFAGLLQPFIMLWVGGKYVFESYVMFSLVAYFFFWQFRFIGVTMKDSAGLWEPDRWKPIIGMAVNFIGSILMVKLTSSVLGVLYPTIAVMLFLYFPWETKILFKDLFKRSSNEYLIMVLHCIISSIIAVAVSYVLGNIIGFGSLLTLIWRAIICMASSAIVLVILTYKRTEYKEIKYIVVSMIKKKFI